ncbi:hypothetical protein FRB94_008375 [Tulasnella sp. JGI-2019a]|nr:hypothetical protein FRB94_008375 [Tulasnella sp. JGI-2019a]
MFKLAVILLFLTGAASNGIVNTSSSSSTAGIEPFVPKLASNASSIDAFIGPVSVNDQHLAGIPSCDAPYVHGVAAPTFTCRAVTVIPIDPIEGCLMDHHPRIRLKSVCYEWCRSWSPPTPIPVPAPISDGYLDKGHTGTVTKWSLIVDVALNAATVDISADVDISMTESGLITIQPSPPVFVAVALINTAIEADVDTNITSNGLLANEPSAPAIVNADSTAPVIVTNRDRDNNVTSQESLVNQSSVIENPTPFVRGARSTDSSTILLLLVAVVLFTLLLMTSCVTLFFVILLRNKRDYKRTADLWNAINTLQYELNQRASTQEENIRLRKCANGLVDTVRTLRDDLAVARDVSGQRQSNIGRPDGSSIDGPAPPRPNA